MREAPACDMGTGCGIWKKVPPRQSPRDLQLQEISDDLSYERSTRRPERRATSAGVYHTSTKAYKGYNRIETTHGTAYHADDSDSAYNAEDVDQDDPTQEHFEEDIFFTAARMTASLEVREYGACRAELSVYGAAIVIPQLARSAHWPKMLLQLCLRSYMFLVVNLIVQGCILTMIAKEEMVMDVYAGQMNLCDFGAFINNEECGTGMLCTGPGGTKFATKTIYPWAQWTTRMYAKQGLKSVFPEKAAEIDEKLQPGEYGLEDYWCRWLCCFLFMLSVMDDLLDIYWMLKLFLAVPTKAESWILDKDTSRPSSVRLYHEMDSVRLRIAGMPSHWKVFSFLIVWLPKAFIWKLTAQAGVQFLMETAGMEDIIVNSVALTFILSIDEMMFQNLMSNATKSMLHKVENYPIHRSGLADDVSMKDLAGHYAGQFERWTFTDILALLPMKLVCGFLLTALFGADYYYRHCELPSGNNLVGGWASIAMRKPMSPIVTPLQAFLPNFFPIPKHAEPFWTLPPDAPLDAD